MSRTDADKSTTGTPPKVTGYDEAVAWLMSGLNYERLPAPNLSAEGFRVERMQRLLSAAGDPQTIPAVHIAGTKGKGSVASMVAAMLTASECKTGLFTSPHLSRIEERFRIDGALLPERDVVHLVQETAKIADEAQNSGEPFAPTFFELVTVMAHIAFRSAKCERVVLEVGLGGRLDTTNICTPQVTVITNVSRDHMDLLGETITEIATEKAGIIKPGVPVLTAAEHPEAAAVIERISNERGAPLFRLGHELQITHADQTSVSVRTPWGCATIPVPLSGPHQKTNAALAASVLLLLAGSDARINADSMSAGMSQLAWPLRIETLRTDPRVIVDAAHNPASAAALANTLELETPGARRLLVFGTSRDKEADRILEELRPAFDEVILTSYQTNPRATPPEELLEIAGPLWEAEPLVTPDPESAWSAVRARFAERDHLPIDVVVTAGSFFLAAEVREFLLADRTRLEFPTRAEGDSGADPR